MRRGTWQPIWRWIKEVKLVKWLRCMLAQGPWRCGSIVIDGPSTSTQVSCKVCLVGVGVGVGWKGKKKLHKKLQKQIRWYGKDLQIARKGIWLYLSTAEPNLLFLSKQANSYSLALIWLTGWGKITWTLIGRFHLVTLLHSTKKSKYWLENLSKPDTGFLPINSQVKKAIISTMQIGSIISFKS